MNSISVQVYVCTKMRAKIVSEVKANIELLQVMLHKFEFWMKIGKDDSRSKTSPMCYEMKLSVHCNLN